MSFSEVHFLSDSLKQGVSCAVFMPEKGPFGSDAEPPYKTVYFLPGYSGDYSSIITMLGIRKQAELKGLAIVMPNGQNAFYIDHPERNANYSKFIGEELIERTRDMFRLSDKREDTYIAGISMGGYGALLNGIRYHDVFSKVAAFSPAANPWTLLADPEKGGFGAEEFAYYFGTKEEYENGPWNIMKLYSEADKCDIPELFIGNGDHDIAVDTQVDELRQTLDKAEVPYRFFGTEGNHDFDTWEKMLDPAFSFLAGIPAGSRNSLAIPDIITE
ncbi:alpha/beta hydrolase [Butyrivibrio sp. AC2005]|uniref:alpha/beta hydrolase n=1 Tax=Butyrivibrio sp. AC2005 TaxID=1280672 RepID=UPI0003F931A3|nr:alpha/beta hydrolase-fold protein [Butyrivibrio sp. AC2005]